MPDSKHMRWADDFATDSKPKADEAETAVSPSEPAANDADGWQQYRRWITKAPAPRGRRVGIQQLIEQRFGGCVVRAVSGPLCGHAELGFNGRRCFAERFRHCQAGFWARR